MAQDTFTVQDGSPDFPPIDELYVMTNTGWVRVNRAGVVEEIDDSDPQNPVSVWGIIEAPYIPPPTDTVPNPTIENTDSCVMGTCTHTCFWDTVGSGDDNFHDTVVVHWYEDGVHVATSQVDQSVGQAQSERDVSTDRKCEVFYNNDGGTGPGTDTNTLVGL